MKTVGIVLFHLLTAGAMADDAANAGKQGITPFIPLILIFGIFYFLIMRPQQKKQRDHEKFLKELKRGDMVVTASGIIGTVKTLSDRFVTLEVDEGVNLKILRSQVSESAGNLKEEAKAKTGLFSQPQEENK
jgi:preprotein translocase subunit YajC